MSAEYEINETLENIKRNREYLTMMRKQRDNVEEDISDVCESLVQMKRRLLELGWKGTSC